MRPEAQDGARFAGGRRPFNRRARAWLIPLVLMIGSVSRADVLRVATYNVANYNVTHRPTEDGFRPDYPKPEAEKAALRTVIRSLDCDVLALQELGGPEFLRELQRDLRTEGCDYPYAVILVADDEPRHIGALSRRPFVSQQHHTDLTFPYRGEIGIVRRGLLELEVSAGGGSVTLFIVHLKSRYTERPDDPMAAKWRAGEAMAVRDRILARTSDSGSSRYLIAGDLNDAPRSRAVEALLRRGRRTISALLPATDSRGERWTHHYRREDAYSRVDHVLVAPALRANVAGGAAVIADGPGVRQASDHRPVVVTLEWPTASAAALTGP